MKSREMALCGVLCALAAALLTLGGVIPAATFCAPVLAMAALLPVLEEAGPWAAGTAWMAVSRLALALELLGELAGEQQILLFTCQRREGQALPDAPDTARLSL